MKRLGMILACCGAMALVGGTLLAVPDEPLPETSEKKNPPAEEKGPVLRGAHAIMAKVCQLSEDQKKKIAERQAERNQALKQYQLDNAEKLKSLQENLKKAKQASNKEAIKRARKELASLSAQQGKISKKARDDIMAVLTDQQKVKWRQYNLFTSVKRSFNTAELTDEQLLVGLLCLHRSRRDCRYGLAVPDGFLARARKKFDVFIDSAVRVMESDLPYRDKQARLEELEDDLDDSVERNEPVALLWFAPTAVATYHKFRVYDTVMFNCVKVAVEIRLVEVETGQLPAAIPDGLPRDPFSGKDFGYERTEDGFILRLDPEHVSDLRLREFKFGASKPGQL